MKGYRLTIDYPKRTIYWLQQAEPDTNDLNQVGLTLKASGAEFVVAAVATKNGKATVAGVQPGDKLIRIDGFETKGATWGQIQSALHGKPGETRVLTLSRGAHDFTGHGRRHRLLDTFCLLMPAPAPRAAAWPRSREIPASSTPP